ncbi:hypothetical protein [Saccharothrix sp. ST-888]|uniref:hypothetical protein n=1 Tax=Saccharothrix sp. ST-888 TaxID=1427391 RepID=UPI0012E0650A|nr:hypothetical protein [Saccharothrix sp. ST-888]
MSRKHYREAAEILRRAAERSDPDHVGVIRDIADSMAGMFKRDNGNFDRLRFIAAVFEDAA